MTARRSFSGSAATCWNFFQSRRVPGSSWPLAGRTGLSPKSSSVETWRARASWTMDDDGGGRELGDGLVAGDGALTGAEGAGEVDLGESTGAE